MENKKNYSDWLIVSDIDGTLNNKKRKTPERNTNAIKEFVHTDKARFTLASARNVQSMKPHYKKLPDVRTPVIVMNGAGIYDYENEKMLWFNSIKKSSAIVVEKALKKFSFLEIGIFTDDMIYLVRPRVLSPVMMMLDSLTHKRVKSLDEVPYGNWGKIIFFCLPFEKAKIKAFVSENMGGEHKLIDTTSMSFDLVDKDTNKGNAVGVLSEILGIEKERVAAIGDYYNDLDMLKSVSHPACAGQAPDDIKEICEFKACHCNKGAVADLIEYIKKTY